ncbi:hypothetical protein ILUMI_03064 [Ignelater luminosus]|uniref:PiggyBac transposable element-derived protein domain-containing protein n=1 Tax=Ignelater luminosus TaxID=2038154 RepID=A0A8K0DH20_IGNLU|nr:hypothetical protein ILUMI_03064 [Ignelater luminosus]
MVENLHLHLLELWQLLLSDYVLEEIADFTNKKVATVRGKHKRFKRSRSSRTLLTPIFVKGTDLLEIKAFLGLSYLQGIYKSGHKDLRSLWVTKRRERPIFRATMNLTRLLFLLARLRFDDLDTRIEKAKTKKLAVIPKLFQIDEMLIPFRRRCFFKMYMPNKPAKFWQMQKPIIYARLKFTPVKKNNENLKLANPTRVILRLVAPIIGTNRNITADN